MANTKNLKLYVVDAPGLMTFQQWRKHIAGEADSNMTKIDAAFGTCAEKSRSVSAILKANGWLNQSAPYLQEISISGLSSVGNGLISVASTASFQEIGAARSALLSLVGQDTNSLTVAAEGDKPAIDIPVTVILVG